MRLGQAGIKFQGFCARLQKLLDRHIGILIEVEKRPGVSETRIRTRVAGIELDPPRAAVERETKICEIPRGLMRFR
jgi:hypothetical protein